MANKVITVTSPSIVTNDTLAGYNNYSDQDGQLGTTMTPTEATNGKTITLSDGVVHEVTTKPVGTANGEFSAVVSNAVTVDLASGGWDLTGASYDSISLDVSATDAQPLGLFFKEDGTKMYIHGNTDNEIDEFDLSTPWLLSSATFLQSMDLGSLGALTAGLFFKPDGTIIYYGSRTNNTFYQRTLSTPWDISTSGAETSFATTSTSPIDLSMNSDGTRMYTTNKDDAIIEQYTLSTAYDITSAGTRVTFDAVAQDSGFHGIYFKTDGTKMYIIGETTAIVYSYNLGTPWAVNTSVADTSFNISAQNEAMYGLFIKSDGAKMFTSGITALSEVYQYSLT